MDPFQEFKWCIHWMQFTMNIYDHNVFNEKKPSLKSKIKDTVATLYYLVLMYSGAYTIISYDITVAFGTIAIWAACFQV